MRSRFSTSSTSSAYTVFIVWTTTSRKGRRTIPAGALRDARRRIRAASKPPLCVPSELLSEPLSARSWGKGSCGGQLRYRYSFRSGWDDATVSGYGKVPANVCRHLAVICTERSLRGRATQTLRGVRGAVCARRI